MKIKLGIMVTMFALSFVVLLLTQSCGNNPSTEKPRKAGNSVGGTTGDGTTGGQTTTTQTPGGGTATTNQTGTGSGTATTTGGTGGSSTTLGVSTNGSTAESPNSGSSSNSGASSFQATGRCVDDEDYVGADGKVHLYPASGESADDTSKCCLEEDSQGNKQWVCVGGDEFPGARDVFPYSQYPF